MVAVLVAWCGAQQSYFYMKKSTLIAATSSVSLPASLQMVPATVAGPEGLFQPLLNPSANSFITFFLRRIALGRQGFSLKPTARYVQHQRDYCRTTLA